MSVRDPNSRVRDEPELRMRDLPRLAPAWTRAACAVWFAVVVVVFALLVLRLIIGRH